MAKHILLVDDDALLRQSLAFQLKQAGYRASTAASSEDALLLARSDPPDLVVLDIVLPGMDGFESIRHFKEIVPIPVIFLTARSQETDEVLALEMGADDYITKPFDPEMLLAHIKAVLRRVSNPRVGPLQQRVVSVGDLTIDPAAHTVKIGGRLVELALREFNLLYALALDAGHVMTVEDLLAQVWGAEYAGDPQVLYVHIRWLREKIEQDRDHPRRLVNVHGLGYKLEAQEG